MDDYVEEPKVVPKYVAVLVPLPTDVNGRYTIHIAAALVTGAIIEYVPEDHAVMLTDLGIQQGFALVDPNSFQHTGIAKILSTANSSDGKAQNGLNITRIVDTDTQIHPISYNTARQQVRNKFYL